MQEDTFIQNDIDTRLSELPEDIRIAIEFSDWEKTIKNIQTEYKLHIDQAQALETFAFDLIIGEIDSSEFIHFMFEDAHLSTQIAGDILLKIDLNILQRIRAFLESQDRAEKETEETRLLLLSEEEEKEEIKEMAYLQYFTDVGNILKEEEEKMKEEGITEEKAQIILEEMEKNSYSPSLLEQVEKRPPTIVNKKEEVKDNEIKEKIEIETEKKTENTIINKQEISQEISIDHLLENTHIEIPYHENFEKDLNLKSNSNKDNKDKENEDEKLSAKTQIIKKPNNILLTNSDIYREPIE